jgi:hypothetical protein
MAISPYASGLCCQQKCADPHHCSSQLSGGHPLPTKALKTNHGRCTSLKCTFLYLSNRPLRAVKNARNSTTLMCILSLVHLQLATVTAFHVPSLDGTLAHNLGYLTKSLLGAWSDMLSPRMLTNVIILSSNRGFIILRS